MRLSGYTRFETQVRGVGGSQRHAQSAKRLWGKMYENGGVQGGNWRQSEERNLRENALASMFKIAISRRRERRRVGKYNTVAMPFLTP